MEASAPSSQTSSTFPITPYEKYMMEVYEEHRQMREHHMGLVSYRIVGLEYEGTEGLYGWEHLDKKRAEKGSTTPADTEVDLSSRLEYYRKCRDAQVGARWLRSDEEKKSDGEERPRAENGAVFLKKVMDILQGNNPCSPDEKQEQLVDSMETEHCCMTDHDESNASSIPDISSESFSHEVSSPPSTSSNRFEEDGRLQSPNLYLEFIKSVAEESGINETTEFVRPEVYYTKKSEGYHFKEPLPPVHRTLKKFVFFLRNSLGPDAFQSSIQKWTELVEEFEEGNGYVIPTLLVAAAFQASFQEYRYAFSYDAQGFDSRQFLRSLINKMSTVRAEDQEVDDEWKSLTRSLQKQQKIIQCSEDGMNIIFVDIAETLLRSLKEKWD